MNEYLNTGLTGRRHLSLYSILLILLLPVSNIFSQGTQDKPTRQSSLEAFSSGNFEKSYKGFTELLVTYPKDPLYKYYSGVSLVQIQKSPEEASRLLSEAFQGSGAVRTVPSDVLYWLGRAQQMCGSYGDAITSYTRFTEQEGKKKAKDLGIPELIQECNKGEGKIIGGPPVSESTGDKGENLAKAEKQRNDIGKTDRTIPATREPLPAEYERVLTEALEYQTRADSMFGIAEQLEKDQNGRGIAEKAKIREQIETAEKMAASLQDEADRKYNEAQTAMNSRPFSESSDQAGGKTGVKMASITPEEKGLMLPNDERVEKAQDIADEKLVKTDSVKSSVSVQEKTQEQGKDPEISESKAANGMPYILSVFEIADMKNLTPEEKISIDPPIPPGLIYRIQIAVFRNPVSSEYFKGISPVYGFRVPGTDKTNYYAGMFRKLADATKALSLVRQKGFKDAFIVSLSEGKAVSSDRAAVLEKQWGSEGFPVRHPFSTQLAADTIPPALSFRVEVTRSLKPLKDDMTDNIRKLAGGRDFDIENLNDGSYVYLIGKFVTFESAEEYADLLVRNGYRDAKVAAWLGKREIPVETARQLFERIE